MKFNITVEKSGQFWVWNADNDGTEAMSSRATTFALALLGAQHACQEMRRPLSDRIQPTQKVPE